MAAVRVLALTALIAFAASGLALAQAPVDWYTDSGSGGVLAQPPAESRAGGALAPPTATGEADVPESDISATEPVVKSARAEPVLGAPTEQPPVDEPVTAPRAAQEPPTATGGQQQADESSGPIAALPLTGLQLAGLAGAGLCLLAAGLALRPRRPAA
jgi:hypothetical protein